MGVRVCLKILRGGGGRQSGRRAPNARAFLQGSEMQSLATAISLVLKVRFSLLMFS